MESKETSLRSDSSQTLLFNDEYFKYIFKKTEKIVCAVFYTVRMNDSMRHDDPLVRDLEHGASELMDILYATLRANGGTRELRLEDVRHGLIVLESKLRIVCAAHLIGQDLLEVFEREIASVMRSLRAFLSARLPYPFGESDVREKDVRPRARTPLAARPYQTSVGEAHAPATQSRRERVLSVIKDKTEATIKDIRETVTDCSEKTIQRELIDLIKDGVVVREGERRWSKYKLV